MVPLQIMYKSSDILSIKMFYTSLYWNVTRKYKLMLTRLYISYLCHVLHFCGTILQHIEIKHVLKKSCFSHSNFHSNIEIDARIQHHNMILKWIVIMMSSYKTCQPKDPANTLPIYLALVPCLVRRCPPDEVSGW